MSCTRPLEVTTRTGWMQVGWGSSSLPLSLLWSLVLPELTKNGLEKQLPGLGAKATLGRTSFRLENSSHV
jgi:hypothetical protein